MLRRTARLAALLGGYVVVVGWLTWPLGARLGDALPNTQFACRYDAPQGLWAVAWETHALATAPARFADGNIYHPARRAVFYGEAGLGALPLFAPIYLLSGNLAFAGNLVFLGGMALTALAFHLVLRRWTGSHAAGFVAASSFLLTPWVLWGWVPCVPYYGPLWWFPLIVAVAAAPSLGAGGILGLGAMVALEALVDPIYVAPAVVAPLGVLALWRLARARTRRAGLALVAALAVAGVLLLPAAAEYLAVRAANPELARQSPWGGRDAPWPAALDPYLVGGVPVAPLPIPWWKGGNSGPLGLPHAAYALILAGGLVALRRGTRARRGWAHAGLWAVTGVLVSTPLVSFFGGPPIRLPHEPLLGLVTALVRDVTRLGVAALVGFALLAGIGFAECAARLTPRAGRWRPVAMAALALAVAGLEYGEYSRYVAGTYPVVAAERPDSALARVLEAGEGPVLELPVWGSAAILWQVGAMVRATFHRRPVLNGYGSYWPAGFAARMALARRLPDADALETLRDETGVATIVVHRFFGPEWTRWRAFAASDRPDLRFVGTYDDALVFAVGGLQPPAGAP
jgi:hypothetical protein